MKPAAHASCVAALALFCVAVIPLRADDRVITTDSGLQYIDLKAGSGDAARKGDRVRVHYTGWLKDGTKFDSSVDNKRPFVFDLGDGDVIKGWDEGVAGLKEGGKRKLIIPSKLAYGEKGAGDVIPPNSELTFEVEFLKFIPKRPLIDLSQEKLITTDSGLKYVDLKEGRGDAAKKGDKLVVHYTGWIKSGKIFDSSVDEGVPLEFKVGSSDPIKGWDEGLIGMKPGGKRCLVVPPELGFGDKKTGPVPAKSVLTYEVELIEIRK